MDRVRNFGILLKNISRRYALICMGKIGMRGALRAMREGAADETWAKEHRSRWDGDLVAGRAREPSDAPLLAPTAAPQELR